MSHIIKNNVKIRINGKNINNYLKRILSYKINIIKLIPISHNEINLIISYQDYLKIKEHRSIYKIEIIDTYGIYLLRDKINKYKIILISIVIGISTIILLSNIIFSVEIIHSNYEVIELINKELESYNIKKFTFKKKYSELEKIINNILKDNKKRLEWIEIIPTGTKYIVRVEERKIKKQDHDTTYQDIVVAKNAVIKSIEAYSGEKIREINDYVKKGDTVISGTITLPNGSTHLTKAIGKVYGEVWYTVEVEYPFTYKEEKLTGKTKELYVLNLVNKRISLFNFNKYNTFKITSKIIFQDNFNLINMVKEKQYEVEVINLIYNRDEVNALSRELAKNKLLTNNSKIKEIKKITTINEENLNTKMKYTFFVSTIEDISEIKKIEENIPIE